MCGISGFAFAPIEKNVLERITEIQKHRGPDNQGIFFNSKIPCGLGHRRLSIIDVSEASNQPFHSEDGQYSMVFNGEIYNYLDLIKKYNLEVKTTGDTEVIIKLFSHLKHAMLSELNGMFVIAIWDNQTGELFIARDRMGIKPLYYCLKDEGVVFSSELNPLKFLNSGINKQAVANYLHHGFIGEPLTIYKNILKFPSGHYGYFKKGSHIIHKYWSTNDEISAKVLDDEKEAVKHFKELLYSSVKYRMISDVPIGTFLSGGIDSSTVTAIAQDVSPNAVNTFSIGFKEKASNEADFAREVAKHLNTNHNEFILTEDDALGIISQLTTMYGEPFADSSAIPTYLVSAMTKKHVTVALSGDGGDELFHGYGMYDWAKRLNNPLVRSFRRPLSFMFRHSGNKKFSAKAEMFNAPSKFIKEHILSQELNFYSDRETNQLINIHPKSSSQYGKHDSRELSYAEQQSIYDINHYLKDGLLVKVDRASMATSLEVRVPLLDHRLVEFALNLAPDLKNNNGERKFLLKQVLYQLLPKALFNRPKQGFSIPLNQWLKNQLSSELEHYLSNEMINDLGILNAKEVQEIIVKFKNGHDYFAKRIWTLYILQKWLVENS